jgi:hypothetical protein
VGKHSHEREAGAVKQINRVCFTWENRSTGEGTGIELPKEDFNQVLESVQEEPDRGDLLGGGNRNVVLCIFLNNSSAVLKFSESVSVWSPETIY